MFRALLTFALATTLITTAQAQSPDQGFVTGPVIEEFGPAAAVDVDLVIPEDLTLKVAFDITQASEDGAAGRPFTTVARFLNMHAAAGVPLERIQPAIVVHGGATRDLVQPAEGEETENDRLIRALLDAGVPIYLCGQSAAAHGIEKEDLIPGVELALSAMTAHAILSAEGYSLNPF